MQTPLCSPQSRGRAGLGWRRGWLGGERRGDSPRTARPAELEYATAGSRANAGAGYAVGAEIGAPTLGSAARKPRAGAAGHCRRDGGTLRRAHARRSGLEGLPRVLAKLLSRPRAYLALSLATLPVFFEPDSPRGAESPIRWPRFRVGSEWTRTPLGPLSLQRSITGLGRERDCRPLSRAHSAKLRCI